MNVNKMDCKRKTFSTKYTLETYLKNVRVTQERDLNVIVISEKI